MNTQDRAAANSSIKAADPRRSAWVSANAGAGKTYTLANRVTRLLLAGAEPERILCLTYTKAAAAEMAGRLFDQLGRWALMPDDDLIRHIAEIGATIDSQDALAHARTLFAQALETPGGLKIQTIHSFCQNLLARFPLEAGVPPAFTVLDDQTAQYLVRLAREAVLEDADRDPQLSDAVHMIVTETGVSQLQQILEAALGNDRRRLERCIAGCSADDGTLYRRLATFHGHDGGETATEIVQAFCAALHKERSRLQAIAAWLAGGGKEDQKKADALNRALAVEFGEGVFDALGEIFLTGEGEPRKKLVTNPLAKARPDLAKTFEDLADRFHQTEEKHRAARAATLCTAAVTIANAIHARYTALKRERGALDYDDLIAESQKLLERRDAAAWVLFRLDGGLDHILIDEAQDTSPEQWAILKKLTEEFFAGESARAGKTLARTIFAVGDEKQSIFSFQGADPVQFEIHRRHFETHVKGSGQEFSFERLQTSRRSAPDILTFVDDVFGEPDARAGLTPDGEAIKHQAHRTGAKGLVEFWPTEKPGDDKDTDPWEKPVDAPSKASPVVRLAEKIAREIKGWIANRVTLPGHDAPIDPGDIMILLPKREPFGSEIIRQLKLLKIPVAGADRLRLTEQIGVMDLIALGRFTLQPHDDLTLATILRSPLIGMDEEALCHLSAGRPGTLWAELAARAGEHPQYGAARDLLADCLQRADFMQPYEFYAHVLNGARHRFLSRLGAEANDAIDEFLSLAIAYEGMNTPSLQGFLQWLEQGNPEIKRDMERGRGEVRVMTVHGSKGLEADIVILPDTARQAKQSSQLGRLLYTDGGVLFSVPKEKAPATVKAAKRTALEEALREHRRLLYVAMTRAKDRLYICGFENKRGVDDQSWYRLAERAAQTGEEITREDGRTIRLRGAPEAGPQGQARATEPPPIAIPAWARTPPPATPQAARILRPSDTGDEEPAAFSPHGKDGAKRFQRGLLIHTLLARLPDTAPENRLMLARKFLAARGVSPEDAEAYAAETIRVLDDPVFAAAFAPGSRAEVALTADLPELGAKVSGRIDRLAITGTEILVIDYKTNRPPPDKESDVAPVYLRQMALYRAALQKIVPGKAVAAGLVWTDGPRLMRLSSTLLDKHLAGLTNSGAP